MNLDHIKTKVKIERINPKYGNTYDICIYLCVDNKIIGQITAHDAPLYKGEKKKRNTDSIGVLGVNPEYRGMKLGNMLICLLHNVYIKNKFPVKYLILSPSDRDLDTFIKHNGQFKNLHKYRSKDKFKLLQFYENMGFELIKPQVMKAEISRLKCDYK